MERPRNPYVAGPVLRGEQGFFGRQETLTWVEQELRNPATNALVLFGQRRIGKTTLLRQLERTLSADAFLPIYFDLDHRADRPLGQVLADLADTVAERAGLERPKRDAFDDQGHFFRHAFLPDLYATLGESYRPVFLLDEFDVLSWETERELSEITAAKALVPFLHRVMTEDSRPAFVFVVGRRADDLSLDLTAAFKASLVREIWVLDLESAEALVRQAEANNTLRFTDHAVKRVLNLTSGHPYMTQLLCQRLWERAYTKKLAVPPLVDISEVETSVPDALEAGNQALSWLWWGLSPPEKIYIAALAKIAGEGETIPEDQVIQVLAAHADRLRTREVERAPNDLVKRRILERAEEREYHFAIELFRRWVAQNKPLRDVKEELDRMDPLAESLFNAGQQLYSRFQWEDAIRHFQDALKANPSHVRAQLHLGEALLKLDRLDEAVAELERAYELDQKETRFSLARALSAQAKARKERGDEEGALTICERVLQISPNERAAQEIKAAIGIRRGDAALEEDRLAAALRAYREAGDDDKVKHVLIRQGDEALERNDLEAALAAYREAEDDEKIEQIEKLQRVGPVIEEICQPLLEKYQIERELGSGGGGRVYLARNELGQQVALKYCKALTPNDVEILQQEARTVAKLHSHPNVAMVYTTERDSKSGDYCVVMEYANGGTLDDLLEAEGRLSLERTLDIAIEVCTALKYVHHRGFVHGDIKPSNILFFHTDDRRETKIADFGLSQSVQVGDQQAESQEGRFSGTAEYAAPEMFGGEVDKRTDLYSLGVVLYTMLVGEPPFPLPPGGDLQVVIAGHLHGDLTSPRELRLAVFDELNDLVLEALAKSPSERFQDAETMLAALKKAKDIWAQDHERAEKRYDQGIRYDELEKWSEAVESFNKVYTLNPEMRDIEQRLKNAQLQLRLETTWREMERALAEEAWADALEKLGRIGTLDSAYREEEVKQKIQYAQLQLEVASLYGDAREAEGAGRRREAIRLYVQIVSLDDMYKDAAQRLARLRTEEDLENLWADGERLIQEEKWEEAIKIFEQMLEKSPGHPEATRQLAYAQRKLEIAQLYTQALVQLEQGDWGEAVETLRAVTRREPGYKDAAVRLAKVERRRRLIQLRQDIERAMKAYRWSEANELLEEFLHSEPDDEEARRQQARVQRYQQFEAVYQQGKVDYNAGRWNEAIVNLEEALQIAHAADLDLHNYRDIRSLLTQARTNKELDALREKGRQYEDTEDFSALIQLLDSMLKLVPGNQEVLEWKESALQQIRLRDLYNQAASRIEQQDWASAKPLLDEIVGVDARFKNVQEMQSQVALAQGVSFVRRWGFPLFIVLGLGLLILFVPGLVTGAQFPEVAPEFVSAVISVFGLIIGILGLLIPAEKLYEWLQKSKRLRTCIALAALLVVVGLLMLIVIVYFPPEPPEPFCNGDFEDKFTCWEHGGDLDQTVERGEEGYYAVLGDPDYPCDDVPVGEAWITQTVRVPKINPTLSLRYWVFSYDLDVYAPDHQEGDYFQVLVNGDPVSEPYGNTGWDEARCNGEPWSSGWKTLHRDLSDYRGQEVEILLQIVSTDPYYNTWTYVDDVIIGGTD